MRPSRLYGSDKPDMRLPAMTDVRRRVHRRAAETLNWIHELPVLAIRIPNFGDVSRKERDTSCDRSASVTGASFSTTNRLQKTFPDAMLKDSPS